MKARLVVLASGNGSNFQALLDACATGEINATIEGFVSDVGESFALQRAQNANVPHIRFAARPPKGSDRRAWDHALADLVDQMKPDWVVLAGFMRVLSSEFLDRFPCRVVNLHPALPGELPGLHAIERAFEESRLGNRTQSGVMVHLVPDEGIDDGPVLGTSVVPVFPADQLADFENRMHRAEHALLVSTLGTLCAGLGEDNLVNQVDLPAAQNVQTGTLSNTTQTHDLSTYEEANV
jgi:phosphoribosylglycinamide formyltransferase 1